MNVLNLTSSYNGNKIRIRRDLIIAMDSLEDGPVLPGKKTRVYLKGGIFKDVLERISEIKNLIN